MGVKIVFGGIIYMENKEGKKRDDPKVEIGGCRKRWLTTFPGQFGKGSVHLNLEYL